MKNRDRVFDSSLLSKLIAQNYFGLNESNQQVEVSSNPTRRTLATQLGEPESSCCRSHTMFGGLAIDD